MKFKKVLVGAMVILATVSLAACSNNKKVLLLQVNLKN